MTDKKLDLTKPVQTRDGRPARIIATDAKGDYPIIALVDNGKNETVNTYTLQGVYCEAFGEDDADLVNIFERTVKYVNVYTGGFAPRTWGMGGVFYESAEDANKGCGSARAGLLKLTFEDDKIVAAEVVHA